MCPFVSTTRAIAVVMERVVTIPPWGYSCVLYWKKNPDPTPSAVGISTQSTVAKGKMSESVQASFLFKFGRTSSSFCRGSDTPVLDVW